jgi:hemerythrin-like domain-containing protein
MNETVMNATLATWHTEHVNFAKLLDLLDAQLDLFHQGETPHYELMLDIMFYMTHYPDAVHHPKEDLAFARIKEREDGVAATVDELDRQHAELHRLGGELVASLGDIVNGSVASRASVEGPARSYVETFRRHMDLEEEKILPMAERLLRDSDWAAINTVVRHIEDPLFGRNAERRYAAIEEHLERQGSARTSQGT